MGVVAIAALHEAFVDAVAARHVELRAHVTVALVARLGLALSQQEPRRLRAVVGVARRAGDVVLGVLGAPDVGAAIVLGMAGQAPVDNLARFHHRERERNRVAARGLACGHMRLERPVAALARGDLWWFLAGREALEVWVLEEVVPLILMAGFAFGIAGIRPWSRFHPISSGIGLARGAAGASG